MEKEILECILKRNSKNLTPKKVVLSELVPAVGKFAGYMSTVNRINFKVILGNGRTVKKSLIIKTSATNEMVISFNKKCNTFQNETKMYLTFKELEYLMEEFQDSDDVLWCQMIHHIPYTCIVMEDLKAKGYSMVDNEVLFDLEHSMVAIHALGRYHGMCKILEERGILSPEGFKPWYMFDEMLHQFMYWETVSLVEGIKKLWDPSWTPIVDKIKMTKDSLSQRLKKLGEVDETKFNVLNHGDPHKYNIVLKYDWNKRPVGIRFVDFQMVHYGSPCLDLTYFMYLAVEPSVRRENFHLLIRTYQDSLINSLNKYQYKGDKPNMDEIMEGMEKYSYIGFHLLLLRYPNLFMTEEIDKLRDMEKMEATDGKEGCPEELFNPERLEDGMGPDIKTFAELYF